jgi:RNA-directed DNA polymerase
MKRAKSFEISKHLVWEAYRRVKANRGSAGVDNVSIAEFEHGLKGNLYRVWNRMSSGCYMPPPVKLVEIPKSQGGTRPLGIPTVSDRVAQMVVVLTIEPDIAPHFHEDSYAYQKNKSAHDAISKALERGYKFFWAIDLDISKFFDTIDHGLLLKALKRHITCPWALMYVQRWLTAPYMTEDGTLVERTKGIPQGSVIGPILANLFLHYAFDEWMKRNYSDIQFERYADDIVCHCVSLKQANFVKQAIRKRLADCKLSLNEAKTKIVYCKMKGRALEHDCIQFDFLGYTFRPRSAKALSGERFLNFSPAISNGARKKIWATVRDWDPNYWSPFRLDDIAKRINPVIQGWINYYGKYNKSVLQKILISVNMKLSRWVRSKYKDFNKRKLASIYRLGDMALANPNLFAHWKYGVVPTASPGNRRIRKTE